VSMRWTIIGLAIAALALGILTSSVIPRAWSRPDFFSSRCASCHTDDTPSCVGCHYHRGTLNAATDLTEYQPGATVTVTFTGGTRGGWIRALLYDQNNVEIDRKVLADIAVHDPEAFGAIAEQARAGLAQSS